MISLWESYPYKVKKKIMYYVVNNIYRSKIYGNNYTKDRKRAKGLHLRNILTLYMEQYNTDSR